MEVLLDHIKRKINLFRRLVMHSITKNIGTDDVYVNAPREYNIRRILVCRPNNRLGNLLLITPLVQELMEVFPSAKIDLFVKGETAVQIFKTYEKVNHIIKLPGKPLKSFLKYAEAWTLLRKKKYDLAINAVSDSSSGRLSVKFANASHKVFGDQNRNASSIFEEDRHIARISIYNVRRYLRRLGFNERHEPVKSLNVKLDLIEIDRGRKHLQSLTGESGKRTISLFTYATGEKCYSAVWWMKFCEALKTNFPEYNIIEILPREKISMLSSQVPTYYSQDIREIAGVIANTSVFIGADSGIMHLANASQTPTVGLFAVTDALAYGPYHNDSIAIDTRQIDMDGCLQVIKNILEKDKLGQHPTERLSHAV